MHGGTVAFVSTPETGHFARLRGLIATVAAAGWRAAVLTDTKFRADVEACGGTFHDLYGPIPIARVDAESIPWSVRHVTYAGLLAEEVTAALQAVEPAVVVHDSFSVVSLVAARLLGLPRVCVCSGHNLDPVRFRKMIERDVRVHVSPRCESAIANLRDRYGIADASPFSYMSTPSPALNLYCEPDEYLAPDRRGALAPVECIGSLPPAAPARTQPSPFSGDAAFTRRAYVSFGTVIWRFYAAEAGRALQAITEALARRGDTEVVVSLGGYTGEVPDLAAPGVKVLRYVDQWHVLADADLFVTHHGLNSTHEAAFQRVPMLSYPFFWDQPALAAKCAELGIAAPIATGGRAPITPADVDRALARLDAEPDAVRARLTEARTWEERAVARRGEVARHILALAT